MKSEELPKVGQLSRLAAQLYVHGKGDDSVANAVRLAGDIWSESQKYIDLKEGSMSLHRPDYFPYEQPMKIQNHFHPRVEVEFLEKKQVSLDEFLKSVIGMTKKNDRLRVFRSFVASALISASEEQLEEMHFFVDGVSDPYKALSTEESLQEIEEMRRIFDGHGEWRPELKKRPSTEGVIASLRKFGTQAHLKILPHFRMQRIFHSISIGDESALPLVLAEALKKGLEVEQSLKNGTLPE